MLCVFRTKEHERITFYLGILFPQSIVGLSNTRQLDIKLKISTFRDEIDGRKVEKLMF